MTTGEYVQHNLKQLENYIIGIENRSIIANKYEILAVERFKRLKSEHVYKEKSLIRVLKFFSLLNCDIDNEIKQYQLIDWQIFILANLFGLYKDETSRLFDTCYLEVSKKNAKSFFASAISIYMAIGDNVTTAHVVQISVSVEQARICLDYTKGMILNSPAIADMFKINRNVLYNEGETSTNKIEIKAPKPNSLNGYRCSCVIHDEHAFAKDSKVRHSLLTGMVQRKNRLEFIITTASGNKLKSPAYELRQTAINILEGRVKSDKFFTMVFTLDSDQEKLFPGEHWRKSNPSLGHSITLKQLTESWNEAKLISDSLNAFNIYHLNQWEQSGQLSWIEDNIIEKLMVDNRQIEKGQSVFCTIDLSSNVDVASIGLLHWNPEKKEFIGKTISILPDGSKNKMRPGSISLTAWKKNIKYDSVSGYSSNLLTTGEDEGYIIFGQGKVLDENLVVEIIKQINANFKIIGGIGFDPWNSVLLADRIQRELGIRTNQIPQTFKALNFPLRLMETAILQERIYFDKNPVLRWMFGNTSIIQTPEGNRKPSKQDSEAIDGVMTILMCFHQFLINHGNQNDINDFKKMFLS